MVTPHTHVTRTIFAAFLRADLVLAGGKRNGRTSRARSQRAQDVYAEGLASSLRAHRPRAEVTILGPSEVVGAGALRVRPHLIVAHRVPPEARVGAFWVEVARLVRGEGARPLGAEISADRYSTSVAEVRTEHVLAVLDRAEEELVLGRGHAQEGGGGP